MANQQLTNSVDPEYKSGYGSSIDLFPTPQEKAVCSCKNESIVVVNCLDSLYLWTLENKEACIIHTLS